MTKCDYKTTTLPLLACLMPATRHTSVVLAYRFGGEDQSLTAHGYWCEWHQPSEAEVIERNMKVEPYIHEQTDNEKETTK